jgi:hypothetical protein
MRLWHRGRSPIQNTGLKPSASGVRERMTGKPEVIGLSTGLVPRNTLIAINLRTVGHTEVSLTVALVRRA